MLQTDVYLVNYPTDALTVSGATGRHFRLLERLASRMGRSYPQAVDNFVDNNVNCLQKQILLSRAIALG
jgi:hypothetical protein